MFDSYRYRTPHYPPLPHYSRERSTCGLNRGMNPVFCVSLVPVTVDLSVCVVKSINPPHTTRCRLCHIFRSPRVRRLFEYHAIHEKANPPHAPLGMSLTNASIGISSLATEQTLPCCVCGSRLCSRPTASH